MKHALPLGKILGVKIYIHWTFIFLIGWIVITGLTNDLPFNTMLWLVSLNLVVFACIILHELGHAVTARRFNISTRHITLLPIGGIAQLESMPRKPREELFIALAGPATNLLIALFLLPFLEVHALLKPESLVTINSTNFLFSLALINIWLAVFNLVPAFPMDGGRVLRAVLSFWMQPTTATRIATGIGQVFGIVFFMAGFIYSPMLIFIGLLVFFGGQYENALVSTTTFLQSFRIKDVMMREVASMPHDLTLRQAGTRLLDTQNKNFVVMDRDHPVGTVTRDEIIQGVNGKDSEVLLDSIKDNKLVYANPSMPLDEAWTMMRRENISLLLVGANNHVDGLVDEDNLAEFVQLRSGAKLDRKK